MNEQQYVYIALTNLEPMDPDFDIENQDVINEWLVERIKELCEAIWLRVEHTRQFHLIIYDESSGSNTRIPFNAESDELDEIIQSLKPESYFELRLAFFSTMSDHWDYNFLKMSSYLTDSPSVTMMGFYKPLDTQARQIYCDGDYDTGIMVMEDSPCYVGKEMMMSDSTHITEADFDLNNYQ